MQNKIHIFVLFLIFSFCSCFNRTSLSENLGYCNIPHSRNTYSAGSSSQIILAGIYYKFNTITAKSNNLTTIWSKLTMATITIYTISHTSDNNILFGGNILAQPIFGKLDHLGNKIWVRENTDSNTGMVVDFIELQNVNYGNYIIILKYASFFTVTTNGNFVTGRKFNLNYDSTHVIVQLSNSNLLLNLQNKYFGYLDFILYDSNCNLISHKTLNLNHSFKYFKFKVIQASSGDIYFISSRNTISYQIIIGKLDSNLNFIWLRQFGLDLDNFGHDIIEHSDGTFYFIGRSQYLSALNYTTVFGNIDQNGNVLFIRNFEHKVNNQFNGFGIEKNYEGGYIIYGYLVI